jgi:hypothetical protein
VLILVFEPPSRLNQLAAAQIDIVISLVRIIAVAAIFVLTYGDAPRRDGIALCTGIQSLASALAATDHPKRGIDVEQGSAAHQRGRVVPW